MRSFHLTKKRKCVNIPHMKKIIMNIGLIFLSVWLISCGSASGVRVTRDSVTVLDGGGVGEDSTGEKRRIKASNDFANVEVEYESGTKTQSKTASRVVNGVVIVEGIQLGAEAVKEGSSTLNNWINKSN